ncbi:MAG: YgaP family membrane protein [Thermodesulfobacteriaceae bacterium]|jgi:uncharacterized membrane protein YphA (DoxX/SURF4 family)
MGTLDRTVRILIAIILGILILTGKISGTLAWVLGIIAVVFLLTSIIGWCPLYVPLGISTIKKEDKQ